MKRLLNLKWLILVSALIVVTGCEKHPSANRLPELDKLKNSKQLEVTPTHLIVRWPADKYSKAVTLKIPREYILRKFPGGKDDNGGVWALNLDLDIHGATATPQLTMPLRGASQAELEAWDSYMKSRILVILDRNAPLIASSTLTRLQKEGSVGGGNKPDGEIYGLRRFSRHKCFSDHDKEYLENPSNAQYVQWLKQREVDDLSPAGCRTNRGDTFLITPPDYPNVITASCSHTSCYFSIDTSFRQVRFSIAIEHLPQWRSYTEATRQLLNSFVVNPS